MVFTRPGIAKTTPVHAGRDAPSFACMSWLLCLLWLPVIALADIHHDLDVILKPAEASIEVRDTITLPDSHPDVLTFALHPALLPRAPAVDVHLTPLPASAPGDETGRIPPVHYRVELPAGQRRFTLHYRGNILHALQRQGEEYARSFQETQGMISHEGVFLAAASFWYPHFEAGLIKFELGIQMPAGWRGMTQGARTNRETENGTASEHWHSNTPQEEIYLIAGPFTEYEQQADDVQAIVLLREPDPPLAQKYLDATQQYIELYSRLIGRYPFKKFAMVENFWETGYGMPSFTLLGPRVIRFPFILHSSYPHEILHNWWGNSVYVDYQSGNWAEGLTSYLADHLIKEQQGHGAKYRRTVLQKYTDHVGRQQDFPLTAFRSRHSARSEAIGYGKTLMLFHMLRRQLGDDDFIAGLRALYEHYRYRIAAFAAVQETFERVSRQPLAGFFSQWVERTGAPQLRITQGRVSAHAGGHRLTATSEQTQPGEPYTLQFPVAVHLDGRDQAWQTDIRITQRRHTLKLDLPARPRQLDIDPEFDVFRRLHRNEIPPAVSQAMGAGRVLLVLPATTTPEMRRAYRALAESWQAGKADSVEVVVDTALKSLPDDRAVWLFGGDNRFRPQLRHALQGYAFEDQGDSVRFEQTSLATATHSIVVLGRHPQAPEHALGWLAADSPDALPGLGRKLPHYGRYSYLAFTGAAPDNVLKGQWPVLDSPMSLKLAQEESTTIQPAAARLAPRKPLAAPAGRFSTARMRADTTFLAAGDMAGRGLGTTELERAADYIAAQFRAAGLQPGGDAASWFQRWQEHVDELGRTVKLANVIGVLPGTDPGLAGESLVIGAHYDHLGYGEQAGRSEDRGKVHPGADDNASGLAVLLELVRALEGKALPRTLVFVAFTAEEHGRLGSRHYVRHTPAYPADKILAMLNLDTVGRLGDKPLILFGTGTADEWPHIFRGAGYVTGVPVEMVADDFGSSDQTSFIEAGIPAVQFFGGNHADVHRPGDTLDKLDLDGMISVARVLYETVEYLAGRTHSLSSTLDSPPSPPAATGKRRVSFGTVPDFTYSGTGVRLDAVRNATPAERAGLREGDIIVSVNETPVHDLRGYSGILRQLNPGDEIRVRFRREDAELAITTRVTER